MRVSPAQRHMLILQTFHSLLKVSLFPYMFNFSIPLAKTTLHRISPIQKNSKRHISTPNEKVLTVFMHSKFESRTQKYLESGVDLAIVSFGSFSLILKIRLNRKTLSDTGSLTRSNCRNGIPGGKQNWRDPTIEVLPSFSKVLNMGEASQFLSLFFSRL